MAGRTVTGVTDRHRFFKGIESLNSVTEQQDGPSQARRAVTGATGRHRCDGPSQVRRAVTGATGRHRLRNPRLGRISVIILRGFLDYSGL